MEDGTETTRPSTDRVLSARQGIGIAIVQLVLVPVLFLIGFGFLFVGMGLNPDSAGEVVTLRDAVILGLYAVIFLTVLTLLIGAPTLLVARKSGHPRLERWAAYIPLGLAAVSTIILLGLAIAGFGFDQLAGV